MIEAGITKRVELRRIVIVRGLRGLSLLLGGISACSGCGVQTEVLRELSASELDASSESSPIIATDAGIGGGGANALAAGQYHTCVIVRGALHCFGRNLAGALGVGDFVDRPLPTLVAASGFEAVVAGEDDTCGRAGASLDLLCWGANSYGQLAVEASSSQVTPAPITLPAKLRSIALGFRASCAVMTDGKLWCWGENAEGQLGQDEIPPYEPSAAPKQVGVDADWTRVAVGQGHVCGIRAPGSLWCWGRNVKGELGIGVSTPPQIRAPRRVGITEDWVDVDAGQDSTCAIKKDASLWCWGSNSFGGLGFAGPANQLAPRRVGVRTDWVEVSIDTFSGCGRTADRALWCWGRNAEGQLGLDDVTDRPVPTRVGIDADWVQVSVGRFHACARKDNGTIWCSGANNDGQLGTGDEAGRRKLTQVAFGKPK